MKSPCIKEALKPIRYFQAEFNESYIEEKKTFRAEDVVLQVEKNIHNTEIAKMLKAGERDQALQFSKDLNNSKSEPNRKRIIVNDTTVEKLGELLNENLNGLFLVRDELSGWLSMMQKEEYQSARAFYLECFTGDSPFTYDRIGRGTIDIENCTLSILGGIQPSKIAPVIQKAIAGKADDGLIQRFQLVVWPNDSYN